MTVAKLKSALEGAGLSTKGLKKELLERALSNLIVLDGAAKEPEASAVVEKEKEKEADAAGNSQKQEEEGGVAAISVDKVKGMTVKELKAFLTEVGAPTVEGRPRKADLLKHTLEFMQQKSGKKARGGEGPTAAAKPTKSGGAKKKKAAGSKSPQKRKAFKPAVASPEKPKKRKTRRGRGYILDRLS